ncbi:sugar-binding protein [Devosia sp. ZB163]|uniref:sugar-binding protein n=1 Tax=Devosia sp. ZB163 TaxID=3025938 RepID=UPI002361F83C|nr:sugar-binding protein [Devosia sp. ZB163]MDC9822310.1 sugar-binding protein [Devosia sp. ZB163]
MKSLVSLAAVLAAGLVLSTVAYAQDKPKLAFVVNAASDFWKLAEAGVKKAQGELPNYELEFKYPAQGTAALQNALMDDLVAAGTDAIMISSADPKNSIDAFNRIAAQVPLFTTDSDAPASNRIAYLGSSNTEAGIQAGEEMVKAMAGKEGKCMGFVGFLGADNAVERINGFKQAIEGKGIELLDVRGDDVDFTKARTNVDDVLVANPEVNCMVGFYSYNSPKIYEALQAAGKLGQITVVAFDEDPVTLGAVKEGSFVSTIVQQPFEWGYQGMLLMAKYLEGDKSGIPENKLIIVPTKVINKENVDAFEADLKAKISGG